VNSLLNRLGRRLASYLAAPAKHYAPTVTAGRDAPWPEYIAPCDVLLIEGASRISSAIKYLTQSTWSHAAIWVGDAGPAPLVEADVEIGVTAVPASRYLHTNVRICRPVGLTAADRQRIIARVVAQIGASYDLKNVFDLARYLLPTPPVPTRWRRSLITLGSGEPTKAICSSLIADAFGSVGYPILPLAATAVPGDLPAPLRYSRRAATTFVPRDFDLSPYFAVIKPTIERRFDYRVFPWQGPD
jgi:hypothetical protein